LKTKTALLLFLLVLPLIGLSAQADLPDALASATIRAYENKSVPEKDLNLILKAGMNAPSAITSRLWEFIVVRDKTMLEKIGTTFQWAPTKTADFAIIVCANHKKEKSRPLTWLLDIGFASQALRAQATLLGIASVPCRIYPENDGRVAKFKELLAIPEHVTPTIIIPFGYPAAAGKAQVWDETILHREQYKTQ
jgi:nitroreductase